MGIRNFNFSLDRPALEHYTAAVETRRIKW